MDKLVTIGILIVIAIFAIFFLTTFLQKQQSEELPNQTVEDLPVDFTGEDVPLNAPSEYNLPPVVECEQMANKWDKDACYRDEAFNKVDEKICQKISDLAIKNQCIMETAITKAENNCTNITTETEQFNCQAIEVEKLCPMVKGVSDDRVAMDLCYQNAAVDLGNEKICQKISTETIKQNCEQKSAVQ